MSIESVKLAYKVGSQQILADISLGLKAGELHCLCGKNGAGKSTLLKALAGLLPHHSGKILLGGKDLSRLSNKERAQSICWIPPQEFYEFEFTLFETVSMGLFPWNEGIRSTKDTQEIERALTTLGIASLKEHSITTLSSGEKRKALLARALVSRAPILLLDEPTAHLDIHSAIEMMEVIASLCRSGKTVLMAQHDLLLAAHYGSDIFLMKNGRIEEFGASSQVLTEKYLKEHLSLNPTKFLEIINNFTKKHMI